MPPRATTFSAPTARARGANFSTVGVRRAPGVLSRADTPPNDGTSLLPRGRALSRPRCPGDEAPTRRRSSSTQLRQPCRFLLPAAGATLHSPITVTANSSDSSGVALKSLTISVVGGATLATAAKPTASTAQWAPGDGSYTLSAVAVDRANNTSEADHPGHRGQHAPTGVPGLRPASVPGGPTLSWSLPGGPYTFTITRDGVAIPGSATSPWTDLE